MKKALFLMTIFSFILWNSYSLARIRGEYSLNESIARVIQKESSFSLFSDTGKLPGKELLFAVSDKNALQEEPIPSQDIQKKEKAKTERNLLYPTLYVLTFHGIGLTLISSLDNDDTSYQSFQYDRFIDGFTHSPDWDPDDWYWNYLGHPLWGSETYLRARSQHFTWWQSFLFALAASTFWEFCVESWVQSPSQQDLFITPLAGSIIGEGRYIAKRSLVKQNGTSAKVLCIIIDPLQSLVEVIGKIFGQDWSEPVYNESY